jgi:hypothetical protein
LEGKPGRLCAEESIITQRFSENAI